MASMRQMTTALAVPIAYFVVWFSSLFVARRWSPTLTDRKILILIAHPDDEAMFFAPTVQALTRPKLGNSVQLLCLSTGDADGLGHMRPQELVKSCSLLGVEPGSVHISKDANTLFIDSMSKSWQKGDIVSDLKQLYEHNPFDTIITFDKFGISSHPNHISLNGGAKAYAAETSCTIYSLTSVAMHRKYISIFDAPTTLLFHILDSVFVGNEASGFISNPPAQRKISPRRLVFMCNSGENKIAQRAMTEAHVSQMRWFRWGWIKLSRYMVVNDLKRL